MSVWDDKDSPLSPKYGEQRFFRPARVVLHGDQTRASSYLPLARNLLGQLVQQDHVLGGLPQSSRWVRMIDPHTAVNAPPASLTTMGVTAHVGYSHGQPHIEIWVRDVGDEGGDLKFGVLGRARINGVAEYREKGAEEYTDNYIDVPLVSERHNIYLGDRRGLTWVYRTSTAPSVSGVYPDGGFYTWAVYALESDVYTFVPFTGEQEYKIQVTSRIHTFEDLVGFLGFEKYLPNVRFAPTYTNLDGDKIVLLGGVDVVPGVNIDVGGVTHPVPSGIVLNADTGSVVDNWMYPVPTNKGNCYLTPTAIGVGNGAFYTLCLSFQAYDDPWVGRIYYSATGNSSFTEQDLRPFIESYLNDDFGGATVTWQRFSNTLNWALQIANYYAKWLPIGNNEALLYLLLQENLTLDNVNVTSIVLRVTPTSITTTWVTTQLNLLAFIQEWVYMGNGVVLAKFVSSIPMTGADVEYRVSYNFGTSWNVLAASGLPGNRKNEFYGAFCVVEPYVDAENQGTVLTSVYDAGAYRSYVSTDVGATWAEAGVLSGTEEFYRVDSALKESFAQFNTLYDPIDGGHFEQIRYFGTAEAPAPFNPALPELMQRPQP